ncbi:SDR family NAD(P)-dependent oxidoreductase [Nostoc sp.]|uniref:SDR family NAD(P)-dependent oxidoreductase n=1 Tax=Nostoc sp. TaxID=1180 RepID=UPI002FFD073D
MKKDETTFSKGEESIHCANKSENSVAIIGMACRFPGAKDYHQFWDNLEKGINSITEIPSNRWNLENFYSANPESPNKSISKWGGFIEDADKFDPMFFGISPREAMLLDPQQRLMLELSWSCLEDSGYSPAELSGSKVSVFVGVSTYDYKELLEKYQDNIEGHASTGTYNSIIPNRISYFFNFHGSSVSIDTACSSSLVAIHQAINALKENECEMALVGGVNVLCNPTNYISFSKLGMLSPQGQCKTFDAEADGYVRGEGAGVILLKPLKNAIKDKDYIYGVIRGSAVNHGGAARTLTSPNAYAQSQVIRSAYTKANISPNTVSYIEAHGTGTPLGDPIEINGLKRAFTQLYQQYGMDAANEPYCGLSTVKTNIGHLESAAGIAGIIKVLLALMHKKLPKITNYQHLNPRIKLDGSPFYIVEETKYWEQLRTKEGDIIPRRAGVSSFGFGGVNAHVVLEEAPALLSRSPEVDLTLQLLTLSAKSEKALLELAQSYDDFFATNAESCLGDVCFTANVGRSHFEYRLALVAESTAQLREQLSAFTSERETAGLVSGRITSITPKVAFLFTGQGSQYVGMAQQLYQTQPTFRQALDRCDEILRPYLETPLLSVLYPATGENSPLDCTAYTQPALFALEYSLFELWKSWGITPDAVMGHSVGEYVAATVAGVFSLEDGLKLIAQRGRLMQALPSDGEMVAVLASEGKVLRAIAPYAQEVSIAAINGPESIVISGRQRAVRSIVADLEASGVKTTLLQVSHAFHSPLMELMLSDFQIFAENITFSPPQISLVSNVTGQLAGDEITTPEYWCRHIRSTVRFAASMSTLQGQGYQVFVEIGPKPTLLRMGRYCLPEGIGVLLPSLCQGYSDWQQILDSLAELYVQGIAVDWSGFWQDYSPHRVTLPNYPWERERYWYEFSDSQPKKREQLSQPAVLKLEVHPLLGSYLKSAQPMWEVSIDKSRLPYLDDHRIQGVAVYPEVAYVEMALAAARETLGNEPYVLSEIEFQKALTLPARETLTLQLILDPSKTSFDIYSKGFDDEQIWTKHATGKLKITQDGSRTHPVMLDEYKSRCTKEISQSNCYQQFQEMGLEYGSCFRLIEQLKCGEGEALGQIGVVPALQIQVEDYQLHPAILDACFQVLLGAVCFDSKAGIYLPVGINRLRVYGRPGHQFWSHARLVEQSATSINGDIQLLDQAGNVLVEIQGLRCQLLEGTQQQATLEKMDNYLYEYQWKLKARPGQELIDLPADYLPSPEQIAAVVQPEAVRLSKQHRMKHYYSTVEPQLDALCTAYILQALEQLGWQPKLHASASANSLGEQLGVANQHWRLLGRMLSILLEDGVLSKVDDHSSFQIPESKEVQKIWLELVAQNPSYIAELMLLGRCGQQLAGVLRGDVDPLRLIFPEGSLTTSEHLYQDSPTFRIYNLLVRQAIAASVANLPKERTVRILEIGAGTGSLTSYVLRVLPGNCSEYVFTDVSQVFTASAKQKFHDYPFISYQLLDIEKDPVAQGFSAHSFDLILASEALYATTDLRKTLSNVKQLLTSEGLLVLLELTKPSRWNDLVFGLLKGWWLFSDLELRPSHPLLSFQKWRDLLIEVGFKKVAGIQDTEATQESLHTVILATGPNLQQVKTFHEKSLLAELNVSHQSEKQGSWLIFADSFGVAGQLAEALKQCSQTPILIKPGTAFFKLDDHHFQIRTEDLSDIQQVFEAVSSAQSPCRGIIHLWSLDTPPPEQTTIASLESAQTLGSLNVLYLVQALAKVNWKDSPRLFLVTSGTQAVGESVKSLSIASSPLWGLSRVITNEYPDLRCTIVDLSSAISKVEIQSLFDELWSNEREDEISLRGEARYVHRLMRIRAADLIQNPSGKVCSFGKTSDGRGLATTALWQLSAKSQIQNQEPFRLEICTPGVLDNLTLRATTRQEPHPGEVEIQVFATGLNFKDVALATSLLADANLEGNFSGQTLGLECAGMITAIGSEVEGFQIGSEVIAIAPQSFGTYTTTDARFVVHKPQKLSFEEAATIPCVFLTAYYALHYLGRISKGERVLIHAAAGGVGLAAIQIAQRVGAEIFATAGNSEKREFLKNLGVKHVMDSRSLRFAEEVMELTGGKGVDIVLNSMSGEAIPKSLSVLGAYGRFIEIGKGDINQNSKLGLRPFQNNSSFFAVDIDRMLLERPDLCASLLGELMQYFNERTFHPLPYRVFPISRAVSAFRYMVQAKHIGKIVVSLQDQEVVAPVSEKKLTFPANGTYLITGGLGGFGLAVAQWLVEHGARHIVLMGRSGVSSPTANLAIEAMKDMGAEVIVAKADVTQEQQVKSVLADIPQQAPLRGIIHGAMVPDDALLLQLNSERMKKVMAPKIMGAWNLHTETLNTPLDFFVMFSSFASVLGNSGSGNYVAANAFLDALAHHRRAIGLPTLTINWGSVGNVGYAAQNAKLSEQLKRLGVTPLPLQLVLKKLGELLRQQEAVQMMVLDIDWHRWSGVHATGAGTSPRFSHLVGSKAVSVNTDVDIISEKDSSHNAFLSATPVEQGRLLEPQIKEQVARIMGISIAKLDITRSLIQLGIDSLMALELSNRLKSEMGVNVPTMKIMQGLSISQLAELSLEQLVLASMNLSVSSVAELSEDTEDFTL